MKRLVLMLALLGLCIGSRTMAANVSAKLVFPRGREWKGLLVGREDDMLVFKAPSQPKSVRVGMSTLVEVNFGVELDDNKMSDMLSNREYDKVIKLLNRAMKPYAAYKDVRSDLAKYQFLLVKLYYWTKQYDKVKELAEPLMKDDRDPSLQQRAKVFNLLSLIESNRIEDVKAYIEAAKKAGESEDSAEFLYIQAKFKQMTGDFGGALRDAARVVAFCSQDQDWMPPAEMLCAQLYNQLEFYDSSAEVLRQIMILYKDTPEYDNAEKLLVEVNTARAQQQMKEIEAAEEE